MEKQVGKFTQYLSAQKLRRRMSANSDQGTPSEGYIQVKSLSMWKIFKATMYIILVSLNLLFFLLFKESCAFIR